MKLPRFSGKPRKRKPLLLRRVAGNSMAPRFGNGRVIVASGWFWGLRLYLLSWMELEAFLVTVTVGVALVNVVMLGLSVWLPLMMVRRDGRPEAASAR